MMMAIMAVLIVVVFSVVCIVNYQQALNTVYASLDEAVKHDTTREYTEEGPFAQGKQNGQRYEFGGRHGQDSFIPISVYRIAAANDFTLINATSPYDLSEDILESAVQAVIDAPEGNGTLPSLGLVYAKRTVARGAMIVAFADDYSTSEWIGLAQSLTVIGLITLVVFFGISLILSKLALRPVEEAWKNQQRFISDASHELKTPLTVISANVSILQKNMDKTIASQSQWVESTEEEITNMRELVDDMLFIASTDESIANREATKSFEPVNLSKTLDGQVLQFDALAFENDIALNASIEEDIWIKGDKAKLQRFIRTLLDNAYKYSAQNGEIDITLNQGANEVALSVHNAGAIDPDDLPHVFERFYRADKARVREAGSYGLGLAIAHDIVMEHGGNLTVTSTPEAGTTFTATWSRSSLVEPATI